MSDKQRHSEPVVVQGKFWYQRVLYTQYNTYSYCDPRYKNMLVCLHPVFFFFFFFFWVHLSSQNSFSFTDGEGSIDTYLITLILKLFALLHFVCLVLLECACYHYEFSPLKSTQSAISRLVALCKLVPTALFFVFLCGWGDGATIQWKSRSMTIWAFTFS